jgi:hypothetical protein
MAVDARELPTEPLECRQNAEAALRDEAPSTAMTWALLAIAGELADLRREQAKANRRK